MAVAAVAMVAVMLAVPTGVLAAVVLDQSQLDHSGPSGFYGPSLGGQSFTAGKTGNLVRVSVWPLTPLTGLALQVMTTSGGLPTGTVIGSGTVASSAVNQWLDVDLDVPAAVTAGTQYAFVFVFSATQNGFGVADDIYAGGTVVFFQNGTWASNPVYDNAFRTYVDVEPDLAITSSHSGNFHLGQPGTYTLHVTNVGGESTSGTVTVTDTLSAGLPPTSASGSGWSCSTRVVLVTCTRSNSLPAGSSYPDITITVRPSIFSLGTFVNMARVASSNDSNPANNISYDRTITGF